jgi:NAD(P)H dehydrogenase (quinone)
MGSPTYFGVMAAEVKKLVDESVKHFGKLVGKVGGVFTSSGGVGGGNETTNLSLLQALLIHGMVVQGVQKGSHYGPVSVGAPDKEAQDECLRYGKQVGELTVKLFGRQCSVCHNQRDGLSGFNVHESLLADSQERNRRPC